MEGCYLNTKIKLTSLLLALSLTLAACNNEETTNTENTGNNNSEQTENTNESNNSNEDSNDDDSDDNNSNDTVSYTHLTLPTILLV